MNMNLRRLTHIMHMILDQEMEAALVALDIEKTFDTLGWDYMRELLKRMGLGDKLVGWR